MTCACCCRLQPCLPSRPTPASRHWRQRQRRLKPGPRAPPAPICDMLPSRCVMAALSAAVRPYSLTPLAAAWSVPPVEVRGIDLRQPVPDETVELIKEDVMKCAPARRRLPPPPPLTAAVTAWHRCCCPSLCSPDLSPCVSPARHRLLVFRDQGVVSGERHVQISQWFGPCESTFYKVKGRGLWRPISGARLHSFRRCRCPCHPTSTMAPSLPPVAAPAQPPPRRLQSLKHPRRGLHRWPAPVQAGTRQAHPPRPLARKMPLAPRRCSAPRRRGAHGVAHRRQLPDGPLQPRALPHCVVPHPRRYRWGTWCGRAATRACALCLLAAAAGSAPAAAWLLPAQPPPRRRAACSVCAPARGGGEPHARTAGPLGPAVDAVGPPQPRCQAADLCAPTDGPRHPMLPPGYDRPRRRRPGSSGAAAAAPCCDMRSGAAACGPVCCLPATWPAVQA